MAAAPIPVMKKQWRVFGAAVAPFVVEQLAGGCTAMHMNRTHFSFTFASDTTDGILKVQEEVDNFGRQRWGDKRRYEISCVFPYDSCETKQPATFAVVVEMYGSADLQPKTACVRIEAPHANFPADPEFMNLVEKEAVGVIQNVSANIRSIVRIK